MHFQGCFVSFCKAVRLCLLVFAKFYKSLQASKNIKNNRSSVFAECFTLAFIRNTLTRTLIFIAINKTFFVDFRL